MTIYVLGKQAKAKGPSPRPVKCLERPAKVKEERTKNLVARYEVKN